MKNVLFICMACLALGIPAVAAGQNPSYPVYSSPRVEQSEAYRAGNDFQQDFLFFLDLIETTHPAFAPGQTPPFDLGYVREEGYAAAASFTSVSELRFLVQSVASRLGDGHTAVQPGRDGERIYPFALFDDGSQLHLQAVDKSSAAALGKQIVQINGVPARDAIEGFRTALSCDNAYHFRENVRRFIQRQSAWQHAPCGRADSILQLTFADSTRIELSALPPAQLDVAWMPRKAPDGFIFPVSQQPFAYTLYPEKSLCYLQFNACMDRATVQQQLEARNPGAAADPSVAEKLARIPLFTSFLDEMFATIRTAGIRTLVIDLRNNSGGNSRLCDELLHRLRPTCDLSTFRGEIRFSKLWELHYPLLAARYREAFVQAGIAWETGKLYTDRDLPPLDRDIPDTERRPDDDCEIFEGDVIFLQGPRTFSSAGMLLTLAADNGLGTIAGTPSSFRPTHYGDLLLWELPRTHLRGSVSHKIFRRPATQKDGETSLIPDVLLVPSWQDFTEGTDPCAAWVVKNCIRP